MLSKFVYWTGASDFLVGIVVIYGAFSSLATEKSVHEQFVSLLVLGMFLMMAAACLMWASKDLLNRYPVVFWQGLVRLTAAGAILFSYSTGLSDKSLFFLIFFDGTIGAIYVIGSMKLTNLSFVNCLYCSETSNASYARDS